MTLTDVLTNYALQHIDGYSLVEIRNALIDAALEVNGQIEALQP